MKSVFQMIKEKLGTHRFLQAINLYPPYLGAGIRVRRITPDLRRFEIEMRMYPWNKNYVGTHFGGSMYSMTDPWFMFILLENLGPGYIVWDKAAAIRFLKPGKGTLRAVFELSQEQIDDARRTAEEKGKAEPVYTADIVDEEGVKIAVVEKTIYVRKKPAS